MAFESIYCNVNIPLVFKKIIEITFQRKHLCNWFFHCFYSRRKWLPPPLRKLSQGKVDKGASSERPLVKKGSDKTFKLPTEKQTEEEYNSSNTSKSLVNSQSAHQDVEGDEEGACDLPPPMKPIQDSQTIVANGPTTLTVVEQSPCKRVCFYHKHYSFQSLDHWAWK